MALLISGLAVMAVIDTDDGEVGRVQHGDCRQRTDIHEELAIASHDQHPLVWSGKREPKPDHAGAAHRTGHRIAVRAVPGERRDVAAGPGEATDDQEILVSANQGRHRIAAVENEIGRDDLGGYPRSPQNCFAPSSFCVNSTATAWPV